MNTLKISERFYSVQGEAKTTGVPAYFIRLTDCNLSCGASQALLNTIRKGELQVNANDSFHGDLHNQGKATWTCDSIPVWIKGGEVSFEEIFNDWTKEGIFDSIVNQDCHVIWTGGEPTLPKHQQAIFEFIEWLFRKFDIILFSEIETNGTQYIDDNLFKWLDQINCSPKLSNSGMSHKKRIIPEAIERIKEHRNHQFKFVVSNEEDIKEVFDSFINPFSIKLKNVYCMPALDDQAQYHERSNFICEMAKKYKFVATQRLHISSWGAVTGV